MGNDEVTVTSGHPENVHAQAEMTKKKTERECERRAAGDDDDVYYYNRWRLKLEGETENMGVCTKEPKGVTAAVLMATPCTNSLGGESGGQKHEGCGGRSACWKYAAVSGSGAGGLRCWSGALFFQRDGGF